MKLQKRSIFAPLILGIIFSLAITLGYFPRKLIASNLLPNVSPRMEDPAFWIKRIQNPSRLLLTPDEIQKMNEENLKKTDLFLCKVKSLKDEWTKEEILSLMKEDWEGLGKTEEVRYKRDGTPLEDSFWIELKNNFNQDSLKEKSRIHFGLIVKRTDIRVFPTEELSMSTPVNYEFDRFQHSSVAPGSLIGIYHFSKDKRWAYVQTFFIRGWVRTTDLAIARVKSEAIEYEEAKNRLMITGNFINVFSDPSLQKPIFIAQMGTSFPVISAPDTTAIQGFLESPEVRGKTYVINIPFREIDGQLTFEKGYISKNENVRIGFLPYTQENTVHQAFKMLHQPYGWGEMSGGRDCSRFIMDIFATFGILMPRNSKLQAQVGVPVGQVEGKTLKEKRRVLDRAVPLVTTLRLPGHIMLYLGKHNGKYYVIHSIWGIQKLGLFGPVLEKIGKVAVSDLSLGRTGPNGSLLRRLTDIRFIGLDR